VSISTPTLNRLAAVADAAVAIASGRHKSPLAADVARLSALFTDERGQRRPTYMQDPALRRAYLGFFVPHNVARIAHLLLRAIDEGALPASGAPRVLDVGAGPLSGLLACWAVWGRLGPSSAVDLSKAALDDGAALLKAVGADMDGLQLVDRSITAPPSSWLPAGDVDVVIAANVLNEVGDPREPAPRLRLVHTLVQSLSPHGRVLVVEPAMRVEARALMAVRDVVVDDGFASVLSPCRGARACPLLSTRGDWCHGDVEWRDRPASYRAVEQATGLRKDTLSASHLLLARPEAPAPAAGLRVVGGIMRDTRGVERRYACGRELVTLAGTPRLAPNVARAARGELVDDVRGDVTGAARGDVRGAARGDVRDDVRPSTTTPRERLGRNAGAGSGRSGPRRPRPARGR
jgi:SAM-dependent methyltransferase